MRFRSSGYNLALILFSCLVSQAGWSQSHFRITGTINQDSGMVILLPVETWNYYPVKLRDSAKIVHGHFLFEGTIPYSYCVRILESSKRAYLSDYFFIDTGDQSLKCDVAALREPPTISNASTTEASRTGLFLLDTLSVEHTDPKVNHSVYSSNLLDYIRKYPNSYPALWKMVILNGRRGYDDRIDSGLAVSAKRIQDSYTGQALKTDLSTIIRAVPGKVFPDIPLLDTHSQRASLMTHKRKYILIDFWFHNCHPCLQTFEMLQKKLKNISTTANYEILCISTDKKNDRELWIQAIDKNGLSWPQYWDVDAVEAKKLGVTAFPTNFLLDENGTILERDIEIDSFIKLIQ